jgi:NAD(P)-dependent dehydrogenase (short-subunit alcohol dehydrogenase family)
MCSVDYDRTTVKHGSDDMLCESGAVSVAVVTGASRGLGAALARELAERGFDLALCATSEPVFPGAMCRSFDVADADAVDRFGADVARELGPIDLWINNAGVLGPIGPLSASRP